MKTDQLTQNRKAWKALEHKLNDWVRDPSQLNDEAVDAPTEETIRRALSLAQRLRDLGEPPPDSVVPDANAGIVFERREGERVEVYHVWDDGGMEYMRFQGSELIERRPV